MNTLYQKQILDYAQKSRASSAIDQPTHTATLDNSVCGDRVTVSLKVNEHQVKQIGVAVRGCALCEAGAGLAITCFTGQSEQAIRQLANDFSDWLKGQDKEAPTSEMQHFTPVRAIRNRHKCVLLSCEAVVKALTAT